MSTDLTEWERDSHEDKLLVATTCRLEATADGFDMRIYVNALDRIALPFRYNLGTEITSDNFSTLTASMHKAIERELAAHHVVSFIAPVSLELDATEVTTLLEAIPGVKGVVYSDKEITVEIPSRDSNVFGPVVRLLNGMPKIKARIRQQYHPRFAETYDNSGIYSYTLSVKS